MEQRTEVTESTRIILRQLDYQKGNCGLVRALCEAATGNQGSVTDIYVKRDKTGALCQGFAFATFQTSELAKRAVSVLDGLLFQGRYLNAKLIEEHHGETGNLGLGKDPFEDESKVQLIKLVTLNFPGVGDVRSAVEIPATIVDAEGKWGSPNFKYVVEISPDYDEKVHPFGVYYKKSPSPQTERYQRNR